jgi:hypothetical protein
MHRLLVSLFLCFALASASKIVSLEDYTHLTDSTLKGLRAHRNKALLPNPPKVEKSSDPFSVSENLQGWLETSFYDKQDSCDNAYEKDYAVLNQCGLTSGVLTPYDVEYIKITASTSDSLDSYIVTTHIYDEYGCDNLTSSVTQSFSGGKCSASSAGPAVTQTIQTSPVDPFGIVVLGIYSSQEACNNYSSSGLLEAAYADSDYCFPASDESSSNGDFRYASCENGVITTAFYGSRDGSCSDFLYNSTIPNTYNCYVARPFLNFFGTVAFKCGVFEPPYPPPPAGKF